MLAFAFLGGLILNLMPCVFPVLAMKARGAGRPARRAGGCARTALSYTPACWLAFAALGGALLAARAAGAAAGWGFQFASPVFVRGDGLAAVRRRAEPVGRVRGRQPAGRRRQRLAARGGHAGSFFTGLLAVLVATPCTAPFMGVAIAAGAGRAAGR